MSFASTLLSSGPLVSSRPGCGMSCSGTSYWDRSCSGTSLEKLVGRGGRIVSWVAFLAVVVLCSAHVKASTKAMANARFTVAVDAPQGENAYCDKGNVAKFGEKDGPADLPRTCYYTGMDGTPSP